MILICISLWILQVLNIFIHSLVVCISSLEKCLFRPFVYFQAKFYAFFLLSTLSCLLILHDSPLSDIWFTNSFFCRLSRLYELFPMIRRWHLIQYNCLLWLFLASIWSMIFRKGLHWPKWIIRFYIKCKYVCGPLLESNSL